MKRRDLERHLRAQGCREVDEGANHTRWPAPEGARSVIPRHREIDFGLARKICSQLAYRRPSAADSRETHCNAVITFVSPTMKRRDERATTETRGRRSN